ncbi:MAG TPA: tol-pal system protein YbgF [Pseudomonadales bacterium]
MLHRKALIKALWPVSLALGLWSLAASAQVPVVEAGRGRGQAEVAQPQRNEQGNDLLMTLYTQLESLQQEVQNLRGMVEEQSNQLRRVQTEQRDRYLDVDRRLSELAGSGATTGALPGATSVAPGATSEPNALRPQTAGSTLPPANAPAATTPPPAVSLGNAAPTDAAPINQPPQPASETAITQSPPPAAPGAPAPGADLGEQDLYRTALNLLLEQSQYDQSIALFQSYIDRFPQGRLLTNAYYWQGEALILVSRHEEARDVFTRLITEYPQDPKAAGAMLKLGVVYQQMGDRARAEQTWREIATRYPENVTEIRAAQDYLGRR